MKAEDIAAIILDECRQRIQANMARRYRTDKGERWINASGRSSAAFKVEREPGVVRLVYDGDDVAPLDTLEFGTDEAPTVDEILRWWQEKFGEELDLHSAELIVAKIEKEGTERWKTPQNWVFSPEIAAAEEALIDQIPAVAIEEFKNYIFDNQ